MKIDKATVLMALKTGLSCSMIAKRLSASERQIRRIKKDLEAQKKRKFKADPLLQDKGVEMAMREYYKKTEGPAKAAARFAITRQGVYNPLGLNQEGRPKAREISTKLAEAYLGAE